MIKERVVNYFLDTEFYENGSAIELISIGVVCEGGREFYRVVNGADKTCMKSQWLYDNVLPHLPAKDSPVWCGRKLIAQGLSAFMDTVPKPRVWTYYGAYDWVAVCQLYGTMMDLPKHFPMYTMDLKQASVLCGSPRHPVQKKSAQHNALEDARWNAKLFKMLLPLDPRLTHTGPRGK